MSDHPESRPVVMASEKIHAAYPLSRDFVDCTRLNLQHHLWKQVFGYQLHPSINTTQASLKIADVGTGTGIWLTDLSKYLPASAVLDGFDVDISQGPPQKWLPHNVKIRQWNVFSNVPEDLQGKYDIVHVRLLVFVIKDDPLPVLHNLLALLKPGGWLQWGEPDVSAMRIMKTDTSGSSHFLQQLWDFTASVNQDLVPRWPRQLQDVFEKEGLTQVRVDWVNAAPYDEYALHECNLLIYEMIAQKSPDSTDAKKRQLSALVLQAARESKEGVMFAFPRMTVVGRKG